MPRAKRSNVRRQARAKVMRLASGYYGDKSRCYRIAKIQVDKSLQYAYRDRRQRKRAFRRLWIARINAAARLHEISYSRLICGLRGAGIDLDRKMLADIAVHDEAVFARLANEAKRALQPAA